jgi:hypothetical protein
VDEILVPDFLLSFHKQTLQEVQAGQQSFEVLVPLSALKTQVDKVAPVQTSMSGIDPPVMDDALAIQPEANTLHTSDTQDESDSESDNISEPFGQEQGYSQSAESGTRPSRILADVFHEIDKVCRTISKKHTHHDSFATAFSDTMLIPDKNDRLRVEAYLREHKLQNWDKVRRTNAKWCWKRVRRYIPEKDVLFHLLSQLFKCWGPVKCTVTGQPLFTDETWKKVQGVLHDVRKGWISDPAGIPLYTIRYHDSHGLPIYHCIRGTNSVEGAVHNPIRRNFASLNASVELADCLIADFRHRHNIDVGTIHKTGSKYLGHYDPWLDHEILKKRANINWIKELVTGPITQQDIDPLAFPMT